MRTFLLGLLGFVLVCCIGPAALAAELSAEERAAIDEAAAGILPKHGAPSVSLAIVKDGTLVYSKAYGTANLQTKAPAQTSMRYGIGSITKQFTAAAILMLVEEGKVSLDDRVVRWVPDVTRAKDVTVRQLLSMTAGYQDYWPQDYVTPPTRKPVTPQGILDGWAKKPLDFEPGTKWQYSNTNYTIAGLIVEKASGMPYLAFLKKRIFDPLGMTSAGDVSTLGPGDAPRYQVNALAPPRPGVVEGSGWLFAIGDLVMTAEDLAKWDLALMDRRVMSEASHREMEREILLHDGVGTGYGLGVFVDMKDGRRRVYHDGLISGYTAKNVTVPESRTAIVLLSNVMYTAAPEVLAGEVQKVLFRPATDRVLLDEVKSILASLQKKAIDRSRLTPNASDYFSSEMLADYASSLSPLGAVKDVTMTRERLRGGMTMREYRVELKKGAVMVWTYTTADGKLEQFLVGPEE